MTAAVHSPYAGYRFPAEIISHAVWLYFRFPLSLRMVDELLAARGIMVRHETVRQWARKFGQEFANKNRLRLPGAGDKWHLDEVVVKIAGVTHWLWRAVEQTGMVLDVLVQSRRNKDAAKRLLRKLLKRQASSGLMRVLSPVVQAFVLAVLDRGHHLALGRAVARQLVRDHDPWCPARRERQMK